MDGFSSGGESKGNRSGGLSLYDGERVLALDLGMGENLAASPTAAKWFMP